MITCHFFAIAKDRKTIFFSSHDVSKPDSGSYLSEVSVKYLTFVCFLGSAQMKLQGWSDWLQSCSRSVDQIGHATLAYERIGVCAPLLAPSTLLAMCHACVITRSYQKSVVKILLQWKLNITKSLV